MADFNILDPSSWPSAFGGEQPAPNAPPAPPKVMSGGDSLAQIDEALNNATAFDLVTLSDQRGNGLTEGNQLLGDYKALSPIQFQQKYGGDVYRKMVAVSTGGREVRQEANARRSGVDIASDSGLQAIDGFNQGVFGLANFGAEMVPGAVGDAMTSGIGGLSKSMSEGSQGLESDAMGTRRYFDSLRAHLDGMDNAEANAVDYATDANLVDNLASFGKEVLRDGGSQVGRWVEDPSMAGAASAGGVGSMFVGGPATKGATVAARALNGVGDLVENAGARAFDKALSDAAFPTVIGAMEGGGSAMQAQQAVLDMPLGQLAQSPEFQALREQGMSVDEARMRIASNAGNIAMPLSAVTGAVTGKLVEGIEMRPFKFGSVPELGVAAVREAVEEGVQSGVGQLSSNAGLLYSGANPDQSLLEGVGGQTVAGAVAGVGTVGATRGPGALLTTAGQGIQAGVPLAAQGTLAALRLSAKAVGVTVDFATRGTRNRGADVLAQNAAESRVSPENVAPAVQDAAASATAVGNILRQVASDQGVSGQEVEGYIDRVEKASTFDEAEFANLPKVAVRELNSIKSSLGRPLNSFDAMRVIQSIASDEQVPDADRASAGLFILKTLDENRQLFETDFPQFLEKVTKDTGEFESFQDYAGAVQSIAQTPALQQALAWAQEQMQMPDQDLSSVDMNSPEGQAAIRQAVDTARLAPQATNADVADQILNHSAEGTVTLTPEERRILAGASSLKKAGDEYAAATAEPANATESAAPARRKSGLDFIKRQIETDGGAKAHQLSLVQHVGSITEAIVAGDVKEAKARVAKLGRFARAHRNKVVAMNQSITNGDGKNVPFESVDGDGKGFTNTKGWGVRVGNEGSEHAARTVHAEAMALARVANSYAADYGFQQLEVPALGLAARGLVQTAQPVATPVPVNEGQESPAAPEETAPTSQATTTETETNSIPEQTELPAQPPVQAREPETTVPAEETIVSDPTDQQQGDVAQTEASPQSAQSVTSPETTTQPVNTDASPMSDADVVRMIEEYNAPEGTGGLTAAEAYPTLVQPSGKNYFHKAFRLAKRQMSRLASMTTPLDDVTAALSNSRSLRAFLGDQEINYDVGPAEAAAVRRLMSAGDLVLNTMKARLVKALGAKADGKPSLIERMEAGEAVNRYRDLRSLNIMEKIGGDYQYNQQLIESAVLAGLDWVLNAADRALPLERQDVAELLGINEIDVTQEQIQAFEHGISLDIAKRSLADNVRKFWGLETNRETAQDFVVGIPEEIAAEILHGLAATGMLELGIGDSALSFPGVVKKFNRVWFDRRSPGMTEFVHSLDGVSTLVADMSLIERDVEGYSVGEPITTIDEKQLRNDMVETTPQQQQALATAQAAPHLPNMPVFDFFQAMGLEAFVALMSGHAYKVGDLTKTHKEMGLNKNHWESVKGLQRGLVASFTNVGKQMAMVQKATEKLRSDPNVRQRNGQPAQAASTFYKHHINRLGRLQMAGLSNPQADKFAREIYMPTSAVLDLSDTQGTDFQKFLMTIAQGIGMKTEKELRTVVLAKTITSAMSDGGALRPLVQALKGWHESRDAGQGQALPADLMGMLTDADLTMHGIHSLITLAKYEVARDAGQDLSQFETMTYLEADGKTNGPINSMLLLTVGAITPEWLKTVAKGGAFFGRKGKTLNAHMSEDSVDLYGAGSTGTMWRVAEIGQQIAQDDPKAHGLFMSFQRVLAALDVENVDFNPGTGELTIKRGITKNPLTITIYGSGEAGIAGKVTDELLSALYEKLSLAHRTQTPVGDLVYGANVAANFDNDLSDMTSLKMGKNTKGKYFAAGKPVALEGSNLEFELTPAQRQVFKANVQMLLVAPMREAIEEAATQHVDTTTAVMQEASQLQSIILKGLYIQRITQRLAMKQADPARYDYQKGEFLSQAELDSIMESLMAFAPSFSTGTQSYFLSGGEKSDLFEKTTIRVGGKDFEVNFPEAFSGSLTGDMKTPAFAYGPTLSGVKVTPTTVVGSGDGQMMLNFASENPEAAKRVEMIFDGMDMPADAIDDYSRLVNRSVFQTWTSNANPVKALFTAFETFVGQDPIKALLGTEGASNAQTDQALLEISRVLLNKFKIQSDEVVGVDDARALLEDVFLRLRDASEQTEARRRTYAEFPMSVDQMASAESPYVNEGTIELAEDASYEAISDAMSTRYEHHLGELRADRGNTIEATEVARHGSVDADSGARVLSADELPALYTSLREQLTPTQKEMMQQAGRLLAGSGYQVVFGTTPQLDAWEQTNNADRFVPGSNSQNGKIDPISKVILISSSQAETVVHELVHAATLDKVTAFYADPTALSKEERDAVTRIEGLMDLWRGQDPGQELGTGYEARSRAEAEIAKWERKGNKAAMVSEFMAWVLGNQGLAKLAARTKVKNPLLRVVGDALTALKDLLWGGPNKGARVGDSLLSNLRFNTRVLMAGPTQLEMLRQDASEVYFHASTYGNERLAEITKRLNNKVLSWVRDDGTVDSQINTPKRARDIYGASQAAKQMTATFAYHFPDMSDMQGVSAFTAVQRALMTEVELNPNALSRMEDLYAHTIGQLDYTKFMENPDSTNPDPNDENQAREKLNVILGRYGSVTDKAGRSSLMSGFLALAVTSDGFRQILGDIAKPAADKSDAKGLDGVLENAAMASMDRLSLLMSGERRADSNVRDALDNLTYAMIENVGDQRTHIERFSENGLGKLNAIVARAIQDKSGQLAEVSAEVARKANNRLVKAGASVVNAVATVVNEEKSTEAALGLVAKLNTTDGWHSFKALVADLVGRTRDNAPIFDMISQVRSVVQQVRQQFREDLPAKLNRMFAQPVSKAQWTAMFSSLGKTDLAALVGKHDVAGALRFLTDGQHRSQEISRLEQTIDTMSQAHGAEIRAKSLQLARYMVTGDQGNQLLRNAAAIANLLTGAGRNRINATPELIAQIDELVSLYAIDQTGRDALDAVSELIQTEKDGVSFVTSYLVGQRVDELAKVSGSRNADFNHYKGHIPSEAQQGGSLVIASDTDHANLVGRGYRRMGDYNGSSADRSLGKRSYYFAPVSSRAPFSQGVLQTVHLTASGIDPETGYTVGEVMAGRITDPRLVQQISRMAASHTTNENLLPVFDRSGKVVAYERAADPAMLTNLKRSTDLAAMLGAWRGRQAEEMMAQEVNKTLVDRLLDMWKQDQAAGRTGEYVNILQLDPTSDDKILIEAVSLIPAHTMSYIKSVFGPGRLMVRREMLLDTLGSRQASVGDLFTGETRWDPRVISEFEKIAAGLLGKNAYAKLVGTERGIQEVVSGIKQTVVVRSVVVPAANAVSNMVQLLNRGVPVRAIIEGMGAKTVELNFYIKRRQREIDLEADLRAARGRKDVTRTNRIESQLRSIQDSYRRLSIWPLIEAGEFSSISNGNIMVEDVALADGRWTDFMESKINKLAEPIKTAVRYGLVNRDTALFQGLARAVQYGDFIAKAVLYDDMTKRKKVAQVDALATVNEAFVNYNRLSGRGRQYLESVGLLWFYNYKLRIVKEAAYTMRNNPLQSLLIMAMPALPGLGAIGTPISDNVVTRALEGALGYTVGPQMGFGVWKLNPWVNMTM